MKRLYFDPVDQVNTFVLFPIFLFIPNENLTENIKMGSFAHICQLVADKWEVSVKNYGELLKKENNFS